MAAHRTIHSITTLLALGGTTLCPHPRPFTGVDTTARASASGELLTTAATLTAKVTPAVRTPLRHPTSKDQPCGEPLWACRPAPSLFGLPHKQSVLGAQSAQ